MKKTMKEQASNANGASIAHNSSPMETGMPVVDTCIDSDDALARYDALLCARNKKKKKNSRMNPSEENYLKVGFRVETSKVDLDSEITQVNLDSETAKPDLDNKTAKVEEAPSRPHKKKKLRKKVDLDAETAKPNFDNETARVEEAPNLPRKKKKLRKKVDLDSEITQVDLETETAKPNLDNETVKVEKAPIRPHKKKKLRKKADSDSDSEIGQADLDAETAKPNFDNETARVDGAPNPPHKKKKLRKKVDLDSEITQVDLETETAKPNLDNETVKVEKAPIRPHKKKKRRKKADSDSSEIAQVDLDAETAKPNFDNETARVEEAPNPPHKKKKLRKKVDLDSEIAQVDLETETAKPNLDNETVKVEKAPIRPHKKKKQQKKADSDSSEIAQADLDAETAKPNFDNETARVEKAPNLPHKKKMRKKHRGAGEHSETAKVDNPEHCNSLLEYSLQEEGSFPPANICSEKNSEITESNAEVHSVSEKQDNHESYNVSCSSNKGGESVAITEGFCRKKKRKKQRHNQSARIYLETAKIDNLEDDNSLLECSRLVGGTLPALDIHSEKNSEIIESNADVHSWEDIDKEDNNEQHNISSSSDKNGASVEISEGSARKKKKKKKKKKKNQTTDVMKDNPFVHGKSPGSPLMDSSLPDGDVSVPCPLISLSQKDSGMKEVCANACLQEKTYERYSESYKFPSNADTRLSDEKCMEELLSERCGLETTKVDDLRRVARMPEKIKVPQGGISSIEKIITYKRKNRKTSKDMCLTSQDVEHSSMKIDSLEKVTTENENRKKKERIKLGSKIESGNFSNLKMDLDEQKISDGQSQLENICRLKEAVIDAKIDLMPCSSLADAPNADVGLTIISNNFDQSLQHLPERAFMSHSRRKLLVLDINGLLADIVSQGRHVRKPDTVVSRKAVFKRPFCDDFLCFCFDRFDVGIWSSRMKTNVDKVLDFLMGNMREKLLFCWDQSHCTRTEFNTLENTKKPLVLKELKKLWEKCEPDLSWERGRYNESNTILLDDSPYKALRNPAHTAVFPHSYRYQHKNDCSLGPGGALRVYLEGLASADDVQKYIRQNPFGQPAITESNSSWKFYSKIIQSSSRKLNDMADQPDRSSIRVLTD